MTTFDLSSLVTMAHELAEQATTRRPSFAPPIPFVMTLHRPAERVGEQVATGARLWAAFSSPRHGPCRLHSFRVRAGKTHDGDWLADLVPAGEDGFFRVSSLRFSKKAIDRDRRQAALDANVAEIEMRLEALAAVIKRDRMEGLRQAALAAQLGICLCCGRALTDPVSVQLQIGPECRGKGTTKPVRQAQTAFEQFGFFGMDEARHPR